MNKKYVKKTLTIAVILALFSVSVVPSTGTVLEKSYANSQYTTHDPIYINGNDEFTSENGVTGGSGKSTDPYIIEDWLIDTSSQDGISIRNVSVYFKIINCYIYNGGSKNDGIVFINVTHGKIEETIITGNRNGIMFRTQYPGKENSSKNYIHHNKITNNTKDGIHFQHTGWGHHSNNFIFLNEISKNDQGIYMVMSAYNRILSNNIISNSRWGVNLTMCMGGGRYNRVYHNNFIGNGDENSQACVIWTLDNDWDDGYPSGGNFWNDYDGLDEYSGPDQNIPGSDGIGDIPYNITTYLEYENDYDFYPLIEPWGGNLHPFAEFNWTPLYPEPGEMVLFNASESIDYDGNIIFYEWDWDNDGVYDENYTNPTANHTFEEEGNYPITLRVLDNNSQNGTVTKIVKVTFSNNPPDAPIINGPTSGKVGVEYQYNFSLSDPDDDTIYLRVDWGSGTPEPWQGPYDSGTIIKLNHTWNQQGTFTIRAQAKDIFDDESSSTEFTITIPRYKTFNFNSYMLSRLFERLQNAFPIIRYILELLM